MVLPRTKGLISEAQYGTFVHNEGQEPSAGPLIQSTKIFLEVDLIGSILDGLPDFYVLCKNGTITVQPIDTNIDEQDKEAKNFPVPFDISDFETIDGVETEDDSLHRNVDTSALSDTVASGASNMKTKGPLSRFRHSLMAYRGRNSLLHDSPSLFVRLRQKQRVENKREQFAEQLRHTDKESNCAVQD
ncbi:hypothetical protein SprV_0100111900 [Sparganum proliferum]